MAELTGDKDEIECPESGNQSTSLPFRYIEPGLTLTPQEIEHRRNTNSQNLLRQRKLKLILDLDHTLLHATSIHQELEPQVMERLRSVRDVHYIYYGEYMVKLRPGVGQFLDEVSSMFELSVFTLGHQDYAARLVKVLSPQQNNRRRLFTWVMSMEDCFKEGKKCLDAVLWDQSLVLIVDDNGSVWEGESGHQNLVQISPYHFDPLSDDNNKDMDKELSRVFNVLREVHHLFYHHLDLEGQPHHYGKPDVRVLLNNVLSSSPTRELS